MGEVPILVMDTSFLIQLSEPGGRAAMEELGRLLGRFRIVVPSSVVRELRSLSRRLPEAEVALGLAASSEVVESEGDPDESVLEVASRVGGIVASMDKAMLREARRRGLATLTLHGGMPVLVEGRRENYKRREGGRGPGCFSWSSSRTS